MDDGTSIRGFANRSYAVDPALRHRLGTRRVVLTGDDGTPLAPGTEVTASQRSHHFLFGCTGFEFLDPAARETPEAERWLALFNAATLPFYWGRFEPERGRPHTAPLADAARWLGARGVVTKGHPLVWHTVGADWLLELGNAEVEAALRARIRREVSGFAGLIDQWDAINEVVIMPVFDKEDNGVTRLSRDLGRIGMVRLAFDEARAAGPTATLLLNDFDLSTAYESLIEGCLEAGVRIDVLGLQSHMHQGYWGEERTLETLERFARYGLPIHFTETTLVSGALMPPEIEDLNDYQVASWPSTPEGEERQADELVRHYRTLLSHPLVEGITYWGLSDGDAWLGAPGGLLRADGTPKPGYEALHGLIKGEWWLPDTTLVTDQDGAVQLSGFAGEYELTGPAGSQRVTLDRPAATASVAVAVPGLAPGHGHGTAAHGTAVHGSAEDRPMFDEAGWDERYRSRAHVWSGRPNATLVAEVGGLPPGTALEAGCGEGADVLWLATRGWRTTGLDVSSVALERAAEHAASAGSEVAARCTWLHADLLAWAPPEQAFDLVTAHFIHPPEGTRDALFARLAAAVAVGGTLLVVAHHPSDLETTIGRPPVPEVFYTADELAARLDPEAWRVVTAEARPRPATDHEGYEVTVHDAVLRAVRIA